MTSAAAAAAKSLQSCPTLCDPRDCSPPGSPVPGILQARTLEWVAISFSSAWKWKVKVKSLSRVRLLVTPWTAAFQAPPSMGFSSQEHWSGVPSPSPGVWPLVTSLTLIINGESSTHFEGLFWRLHKTIYANHLVGMKEKTDRTGSILKAGLHLGLDCGLWAICPVLMETTYQLENQAPWMKEPQGSYLDSLLPKRIP